MKAEAVRSSEPEVSRHPQLAPVEYLGDGSSSSQQLGSVDLSQYDSYRWAHQHATDAAACGPCCRPASFPPAIRHTGCCHMGCCQRWAQAAGLQSGAGPAARSHERRLSSWSA